MKRKSLNIGLFGYGFVGTGLYEVLQKTTALTAGISKICVKDRDKLRNLPASSFTFEKSDILNDPAINVVIELIDDADAAFEIVSEALKQKKAVITANKKMIAKHFKELIELQREYKTPLLYEGACCASIPIIRILEEYYDTDLLESVEGIINGSTNYILTKTMEENISYKQALIQAQEKGYAENNPSLDTQGFDAKFKLLILLVHSFGLLVTPEEIFNLGIDKLGKLEFQFAREKNYKIKLIARAYRDQDSNIIAFVLPMFIGSDDRLFGIDDVYNGIQTKTSFADIHFFSGKGAGAFPTASAVLSDLSALTYDYKYEYKKLRQISGIQLSNDVTMKIMLRFKKADADVLRKHFEKIEEFYENGQSAYIIGNLRLNSIKEIISMPDGENSIVAFG
jgi:homoserine dehydrogenase